MATKVIMPQMGEAVAEGTILKWFKQEGDRVVRDEPLVEIHTEKIDVEVPSPASGVLSKILAREGETLPVGREIALIEEVPAGVEEGRPAEEKAAVLIPGYPEVGEAPRVELPPTPPPRPAEAGVRRVTPVVARLAEKYQVELDRVAGTGAGGRITKKDILDYLAVRGVEVEEAAEEEALPAGPPPRPPEAPPRLPEVPPERPATIPLEGPFEIIPLAGMRKAIADHMVLSKRTSPHVTTVLDVDMTRLVDFRERHQEEFERQEGIPLTYMPFIVKAVVNALKEYPMMNSSLQEGKIILKKYYHIGVAVALEEGLIVPVVREADKKDMRQLVREIHDLATRARAGKLTPNDLQGGTFSITNPGVFGAIISTPIIHQPQAAILGVEAIRKTPVVRNDEIVIRSMMNLCLSYDHRIVDGATAIRFLQRVRRPLENPLELIL